MVPNYEVKALLKSSAVVDSDNQLKGAVLSAFFTQPVTKRMNVQFLDTVDQDIYTQRWNLRIRKLEGKRKFELTYKKRYPIGVGSSTKTEGDVDAALETAEQDGFGSKYAAQVELGYNSQTLSISRDEEVPSSDPQEVKLPLADVSCRLLADHAPKEFSSWGSGYLDRSIIFGPVFATRTKGDWNGLDLSIESWPIRRSRADAALDHIVEASFKAASMKKALEGQARLVGFLQQQGWFLAENSWKTELIMARYGKLDANSSLQKL